MKKQFKIVVLILSFLFVLNVTGCTLFNIPLIEQPGGHFYNLGGSSYVTYNGAWAAEAENSLIPNGMITISSSLEVDEIFGESIYNNEQAWTNEEFFENNQIVCFVFAAGSGMYTYKLLKTNYKNNILTITIIEERPEAFTCDVKYWLAIIEIEKVSTDTVVEIKYIRS